MTDKQELSHRQELDKKWGGVRILRTLLDEFQILVDNNKEHGNTSAYTEYLIRQEILRVKTKN